MTTAWADGDSFGRQVRSAAILKAMNDQIAEWETERQQALKKAQKEPQYTTWRLRAEQLEVYIMATKFWIDKIGQL